MSTQFLRRFFDPASIAVVGASEKPESTGGQVIRNLLDGGYGGKLWAVNPKGYASVHGVECVARTSQLPEVVDLAILCSPVSTLPKLLSRLGERGVRAALVAVSSNRTKAASRRSASACSMRPGPPASEYWGRSAWA